MGLQPPFLEPLFCFVFSLLLTCNGRAPPSPLLLLLYVIFSRFKLSLSHVPTRCCSRPSFFFFRLPQISQGWLFNPPATRVPPSPSPPPTSPNLDCSILFPSKHGSLFFFPPCTVSPCANELRHFPQRLSIIIRSCPPPPSRE